LEQHGFSLFFDKTENSGKFDFLPASPLNPPILKSKKMGGGVQFIPLRSIL